MRDSVIDLAGTKLGYREAGAGATVLFLHGAAGAAWDPLLDRLSNGYRMLAPEHPGFGRGQIPDWMMSVGDVAFFYLDLMQALDLRNVHLVGHGLGGWIAAEIAVKDSSRLSRLVMANAIGVKIGDRETRDIVDIWALMPDEFNALAYFNPKAGERDYKNLPEAESLAAARNREAYARLAWSPYMHNPKLKNRLHRIKLPTLFLWGTADRVLSDKYGRGYCDLIAGAKFEPIEKAGHFPHIEQPEEFARRVLAFADAAVPAALRTKRA